MPAGAEERIERVERVADLLAFLLNRRQPASMAEIVEKVPGYPEEGPTARMAVERDKRLLREEGIPVTTVTGPDGVVLGYLIRPEDYYLPDLGLTPDETVALNLAMSSVRLEGAPVEQAQWKLGGVEGAPPALVDLPVPPAVPVLRTAVRERAPARFLYGGRPRVLHPYGLLSRAGFWYVSGPEEGTELIKHFRIDRIEGDIELGPGGRFRIPAGLDPWATLATEPWGLGGDEPVDARVLIDPVMAARVEAEVGASRVTERRPGGSVVVTLPVVHRGGFRSWVLGMRDHAVVLGPEELVSDVVAWLQAIVDGGQAPATTGTGQGGQK